MNSLAASDPAGPQPLPSLPPSPTEEDLGKPDAWGSQENDDEGSAHDLSGRSSKGKARYDGQEGEESEDEDTAPGQYPQAAGYPPTADEAAEERRVAENLRRWEAAERERRRAARDSQQGSGSASVVGDVARRVSTLVRRGSRAPSGVGAHAPLQDRTNDEGVPLEHMDVSPLPSPLVHSPFPSRPTTPENPFRNPNPNPASSSASPFDDSHQATALMSGTSVPPTPATADNPTRRSSDRRSSQARRSLNVPPPAPLSLPEPTSPPPPTATAPGPIPPPVLSPIHQVEDEKPTRWWTDWLCGCSEGPDRGGDKQAAKTNPME